MDPRLSGRPPTTTNLFDRPIDRHHLEQQIELTAFDVNTGFQRRHRQHLTVGQCSQGGVGTFLGRHGCGCEVGPYPLVLRTRKQQDVSVLSGATGSTDLLVVGDGGAGCSQMNHEPQIGLVEPHAKSTRRDECFHLVVAQSLLEGCSFLGVRASGVGAYLVPGLDQCSCGVLRRGDRQAVDDPGPWQLTQVLHEPGQAVGRPRQVEHS